MTGFIGVPLARIAAKSAVTAVFSTALLAGCAGNNALQPAPGANGFGILSDAHARPNPCCVRTVFISDTGTNQVQLFDFRGGTYVGPLPQPPETFNSPEGECVDAINPQNVFIANEGMSTIDEYTHGGTFVMSLADTGEYPTSCAYRQISSTSALLAVGNVSSPAGGGSVSVYAESAGVWSGPTIYTPPGSPFVHFMDYRGSNLFLDASAAGTFEFMRMSSGGTFTPIPIVGATCPINVPGAVQRVNNYLAVGDQSPNGGCPNIYHVLPSGAVVGSTTLLSSFHIVQFFRKGPRLVAADSAAARADLYVYPSGGQPILTMTPLVVPFGAAISHQ